MTDKALTVMRRINNCPKCNKFSCIQWIRKYLSGRVIMYCMLELDELK